MKHLSSREFFWLTDSSIGLAIMMGTVWLRLDASQESIIPLINAIF